MGAKGMHVSQPAEEGRQARTAFPKNRCFPKAANWLAIGCLKYKGSVGQKTSPGAGLEVTGSTGLWRL